MDITATLSADLALLAQVLDRPRTDLAEMLRRLVTDARSAVSSYRGLSLTTGGDAPFIVTLLQEETAAEDVRTSILVPLRHGTGPVDARPALILYAAQPGAFVDLAADLSWLTGIAPREYALDQHLSTIDLVPTGPPLRVASVVNQAIGVLIGRGHPPEQAREELAALALAAGTGPHGAAVDLLRCLSTEAVGPIDLDNRGSPPRATPDGAKPTTPREAHA